MKQKIKTWFKRQSKQSKIILLITFTLYLGVFTYQTPFYTPFYLLTQSQYGLDVFLGELLGRLLGMIIPLLLASAVIALIPYLVFKGVAEGYKKYLNHCVAEKYKKYLDYFAVTFLIVSILFLYQSFKILPWL